MIKDKLSNIKLLIRDPYTRQSFFSYHFTKPNTSQEFKFIEETEHKIIELIQSINPTGTCLDIGAHAGYYTRILSKTAKLVIAIEPDKRNISRIPKLHNILPLRYAINTKCGTSRLTVAPNSTGNSLLNTGYKISVPSITIDKLITHNIDLIKMDIEELEYIILQSLDKKLFNKINKWIIECHNKTNNQKIENILTNNGYTIKWYNNTQPDKTDHIYGYR